MSTIKLGHFNTEEFRVCEGEGYPFPKLMQDIWGKTVLDHVKSALSRCTSCNFVLDGITLPLNLNDKLTHQELNFVLNQFILLDKVSFFLKGEKVETDYVLKTYKL